MSHLRLGLPALGLLGLLTAFAAADPPPADEADDRHLPSRIIPPAQAVQTDADRLDDRHRDGRRVTVVRPRDEDLRRQEWRGRGRYPHAVPYHYLAYDPFAVHFAILDAYHAGRADERAFLRREFNRRDMEQRRKRAITRHDRALVDGLEHLSRGDAARAIRHLTLAADLDQGDPACRIHLAQARLALGQYERSAAALRRALQLQPRLIYLDLDLDRYYRDEGTLGRLTNELAEHMRENGTSAEVHFLRGFLEFQRGDHDAAHAAFHRVAGVLPRDELTREFLAICVPEGE